MSDVTMCQTTCMSGRSIVFFTKIVLSILHFFSHPKCGFHQEKELQPEQEAHFDGKKVQNGAHSRGWLRPATHSCLDRNSFLVLGYNFFSPITWKLRCKARPPGNVTSGWHLGSGRSTKGHIGVLFTRCTAVENDLNRFSVHPLVDTPWTRHGESDDRLAMGARIDFMFPMPNIFALVLAIGLLFDTNLLPCTMFRPLLVFPLLQSAQMPDAPWCGSEVLLLVVLLKQGCFVGFFRRGRFVLRCDVGQFHFILRCTLCFSGKLSVH